MEVLLQVDKIVKFTIILFPFTLGGSADTVVDNRTNSQGCQYNVYFI